MNKKELTAALESIGMRPGRGLGQNFLLDPNLLEFIVRLGDPKEGETILEVGPGFGALTRLLLARGAVVYAVEFDHRIAEYLRKNITDGNFRLIEADACRVDFATLFPKERPFRAIANLPYSISTVFIARMLGLANSPAEMFFMLQKEMGERLAAGPGCKSYGALSARTQLKYEVRIERIVPPEVFLPPPEVDSAVVSFRRHDRYRFDAELCRLYPGVVKTAFAQRRKQLGKVLGQNYGKEKVLAAFEKVGIPVEIRPDRLTVEDFVNLTRAIFSLPEA